MSIIDLMLELPVAHLIPLVGSLLIPFLMVAVASAQPGDRVLRPGKPEEAGMSASRLQQAL